MERLDLVYLLIGATVALIVSLHSLGLEAPEWIYVENGLVENSTALAFLVVLIVALWKARRSYIGEGERDIQYIAFIGFVSALGLIGFLDEVSFGKQVIHYDSPSLMDVNLTSVHSLVIVFHRWVRLSLGISRKETVFLIFGVFAAMSVMIAIVGRKQVRSILRNAWEQPYWHSIIACIVFLMPAVIIDAGVSGIFDPEVENAVGRRGPSVLEELLELSAALALLYGVIISRPQRRRGVEVQTDLGR